MLSKASNVVGVVSFTSFLTAKSSCAEICSQLYVALDVDYLDQTSFDRLMKQTEEVAHILGGLQAAADKQRRDGGK